jgi:hypothetical protein
MAMVRWLLPRGADVNFMFYQPPGNDLHKKLGMDAGEWLALGMEDGSSRKLFLPVFARPTEMMEL